LLGLLFVLFFLVRGWFWMFFVSYFFNHFSSLTLRCAHSTQIITRINETLMP
jgi:hypothetical protein